MGVASVMLTGDNERTGRAIAGALGMDVRAGLLPDQKLREIEALKARGPVVMVGDGINDAPVLAAASVGVLMGVGTAVALETADAALLRGRVSGIAELVALSRATLSNIKQNVAVATTRSLYPSFSNGCKHWEFILLPAATRAGSPPDGGPNLVGLQVRRPDLEGCAGHDLFGGQQLVADQAADDVVADRHDGRPNPSLFASTGTVRM